jgi:hypothetical protein
VDPDLTLKDVTDWLSRNVGKELQLYAAWCPRSSQFTSVPRAEVSKSHRFVLFALAKGLGIT